MNITKQAILDALHKRQMTELELLAHFGGRGKDTKMAERLSTLLKPLVNKGIVDCRDDLYTYIAASQELFALSCGVVVQGKEFTVGTVVKIIEKETRRKPNLVEVMTGEQRGQRFTTVAGNLRSLRE